MEYLINSQFSSIKKNILIVEDNCDLLNILSKFFLSSFNVKACSDYKTSIKIVSSKWPNVILTDEKLGDGSGLDLVKYSKKVNKDIKAAIFTGNSSETLAIEAIKTKVDYFFIKPISVEEVFLKINELSLPYDENHPDILTLTNREKEILELIMTGLKPIEISKKLNISILTVRTHLKSIYKKLNCRGIDDILIKHKI